MPNFDGRLEELYIDLPESPKIGGQVNISQSGRLVFVSGQLPYAEGRLDFKGRVGLELTPDAGRAAARAAAVQVLGVLKEGLGSLNKIKKIVHMRLYVATGAEFKGHQKVVDGALELFADVFGSHAACSTEVAGCASLPEGAAVELAVVVEVK